MKEIAIGFLVLSVFVLQAWAFGKLLDRVFGLEIEWAWAFAATGFFAEVLLAMSIALYYTIGQMVSSLFQ